MTYTRGEGSTIAEQRAYARGYNRGRARDWKWVRRLAEIAKAYRARLRDAPAERRCENCRRWERGGEGFHWGYCRGDFDSMAEPRMWPQRRDYRRLPDDTLIATQESFGCVCFLPRE